MGDRFGVLSDDEAKICTSDTQRGSMSLSRLSFYGIYALIGLSFLVFVLVCAAIEKSNATTAAVGELTQRLDKAMGAVKTSIADNANRPFACETDYYRQDVMETRPPYELRWELGATVNACLILLSDVRSRSNLCKCSFKAKNGTTLLALDGDVYENSYGINVGDSSEVVAFSGTNHNAIKGSQVCLGFQAVREELAEMRFTLTSETGDPKTKLFSLRTNFNPRDVATFLDSVDDKHCKLLSLSVKRC